MKRIITVLLTALLTLSASAQLSDGYYRLQCKQTGRYLAVHNNYVNKEAAKQTGQIDLQSLETIDGFDNIVNDPGSIIYLKKTSKGYVIEAQGFTTESKNLYLKLTKVNDAYRIYSDLVYNGVKYTRYLRDYQSNSGQTYITTDASKSTNWEWYITPVSASDKQYFGLKGDVKVGKSYYTTIYATFPIKLGSGMKAFAVNSLTESSCALKDIGNVIPAKTPVVIQCAGKDASGNKVTPLASDNASVSGDKLDGVVFCYPVIVGGKERRKNPMWNAKDYDPETMRILGEADGKLCFITANKADYPYLAANRAYLPVAKGSALNITTDGTTGIVDIDGATAINADKNTAAAQQQGTYTLSGVRLPENSKPLKGLYIKDGKVIAIR